MVMLIFDAETASLTSMAQISPIEMGLIGAENYGKNLRFFFLFIFTPPPGLLQAI